MPLTVPALSDLAISIHLPQRTPAATVHGSAFQTNYRLLARRLQDRPALRDIGVLNKGIGGNRLLHNGATLEGTPFAGSVRWSATAP